MGVVAEVSRFEQTIRNEVPRFRVLRPEIQSIGHFNGQRNWLDHMVIRQAMPDAHAEERVTECCAVVSGQSLAAGSAVYRRPPDHCPIAVEAITETKTSRLWLQLTDAGGTAYPTT